jgi:hypothetical protein
VVRIRPSGMLFVSCRCPAFRKDCNSSKQERFPRRSMHIGEKGGSCCALAMQRHQPVWFQSPRRILVAIVAAADRAMRSPVDDETRKACASSASEASAFGALRRMRGKELGFTNASSFVTPPAKLRTMFDPAAPATAVLQSKKARHKAEKTTEFRQCICPLHARILAPDFSCISRSPRQCATHSKPPNILRVKASLAMRLQNSSLSRVKAIENNLF